MRSLVLRSRARFARPRSGRSVLREGLEVRIAFTSVALSSRDDPSHEPADLGSIGEDHGERDHLSHSDRDDSPLAIAPARVVAL